MGQYGMVGVAKRPEDHLRLSTGTMDAQQLAAHSSAESHASHFLSPNSETCRGAPD